MLFARCPNPYACQANPIPILEFDVVAQYQMLRRLSQAKLLDYFFAPKTPSFAALATRNLTTVLAGILIFCCVFGLKTARGVAQHLPEAADWSPLTDHPGCRSSPTADQRAMTVKRAPAIGPHNAPFETSLYGHCESEIAGLECERKKAGKTQ
jgi:hypothetical protein